jgi:D-inositol-3-phosphate glycosyltransferase
VSLGVRLPLVAIGAYLPQTGFTRVLLSVLSRLAATCDYDIHYVGLGYKGPPFEPFEQRDTGGGRVVIYPCNLQGGDVFGAWQGAALAHAVGARAVLLLNDLWILKNYIAPFAPLRQQVKVLAYAPLDGRLPDPSWIAPLVSVDRFIVYTRFAQQEVRAACATLAARGTTPTFADVDVIPHGVDTTVFHPFDRRAAREALFPDRPDLWEAFLILNANRPVPRKRIDLTIEGFAAFARHAPAHVKLYLHHAILNIAERDQILAWARQSHVVDRLILPPVSEDTTPTSDAHLNLIYNACDIGLNTAMGEGWGLVSLEHAATGAPQVVPRHSACAEIWEGGAALLEVEARYVPSFSPLEMATVAPPEVGRALERLYTDEAYRRMMSKAAYQTATRASYTWDAIARQWASVIQETIETTARETAPGEAAPGETAARETGDQHTATPERQSAPHRARG